LGVPANLDDGWVIIRDWLENLMPRIDCCHDSDGIVTRA